MVQPAERFSERVVFYVTPTMKGRFDAAVESSDLESAGWLRHWLDDALVRHEVEELIVGGAEETSAAPVSSQLAAAQARLEGQEEVVQLLRERLGLADAQNIELNRRLEESHATMDRAMLALPAPSKATRRSWQFWRR